MAADIGVGVVFVLLSLFCCIENATTSNRFRKYCKSAKHTEGFMYTECSLIVKTFWDFNDFRKFTERQSLQKKVSLNVNCIEGGAIFLPWPMKAKNLFKLNVKGCLLKGYHAEQSRRTKYPDSLLHLSIKDCKIEADIEKVIARPFHLDQTTRDYQCGQETLITSIMSNITYSFLPSGPVDLDLMSASFDALVKYNQNRNVICNFAKLEHLEETVSNTRSKLFFDNLAYGSKYPRLRFLNLSANALPFTSKILQNWSIYFPALEYLDLSSNFIKEFKFEPSIRPRTRPLYVNLRNNKIEKIPDEILTHLIGNTKTIVDLRYNPIDCRYCSTSLIKTYFAGMLTRSMPFSKLFDVKCHMPSGLRGKKVMDISTNISCVP